MGIIYGEDHIEAMRDRIGTKILSLIYDHDFHLWALYGHSRVRRSEYMAAFRPHVRSTIMIGETYPTLSDRIEK